MTRTRHLEDPVLVALARRPGARIPAAARAHLGRCARCQRLRADLSALADHLGRGPREPSAGVEARAWALMAPRPPRAAEATRFALARLVHDSYAGAPASGMRTPLEARHQLWRSPRLDLALRLEPTGLGAPGVLLGQVFRRRAPAGAAPTGIAWLIERHHPARWSELSAAGEFELPAPRGPRSVLLVEWGLEQVRVELP